MPSFTPVIPSGSPGGFGRVIPVAATATPGTLIHTAITGTSGFDEVSLWAANVTNTAATITLEWGGVTSPGDHLVDTYTIPANSPMILLADRHRLNSGAVVRAYSGTASAINVMANVDRIQ